MHRLRVGVLAASVVLLPMTAPGGTPVNTGLSQVQAPRAQAFGGAVAALDGDPSAIWFSPVAAGRLSGSAISLAGRRGRFEELSGQSLWVAPFPERRGALGVGILWFDAGSAVITASDGTIQTLDLQRDLLALVSYGITIGEVAESRERMAFGATLKVLRSNQYGHSANAVAGDLAAHYSPVDWLTGGVLVQNLGSKLKYFEDSIELPTAVRVGVGVRVPSVIGRHDHLLLLADAEYPMVEESLFWRGGAEYLWRRSAALRGGIYVGSGRMRVSAGFGFRVGRFRVDYSSLFGGYGEIPHSMSLSYSFGATPLKKTEEPPLPEAAAVAEFDAEKEYRAAIELYTAGQYAAARLRAEAVVREEPGHWEAWHLIGNCLYSVGNRAAAVAAYRESLKINPDNPGLKSWMERVGNN